ncbi:protein kinase [bacterium]|nr:protein kinase [bacterium]
MLMIICPHCGSENDDLAHYCSACGHELSSREKAKIDTDPLFQKERKRLEIEETFKYPLSTLKTLPSGHLLLNRYEILKLIGKGGMSVVYKAHDVILDEMVALKILKPSMAENQDMVQRFKREIKLGRKIKHPNVCHIYDFGFVEELFFISMEFLDGTPLSKTISNIESLPLDVRVEITRGILEAIAAAHKENIIHRDLKPSNIMLVTGYKPVIMDFGISRMARESDITAAGDLLGTPIYMAPDQFTGNTPDQRSDIYALGVIFYELFTGMPPFTGETAIEIAMKHLKNTPRKPSKLNPDIPVLIEQIILKCLEKEPGQRYQTVREILQLFREAKSSIVTREKKEETLKRVLIADDDYNIRTLLGVALKKNGLDVIYAQNGHEALSMCLEGKPDVIVTDLMMPQMDGLQMIEFLKDNTLLNKTPLVVISAKSDKDYIAYCKSMGIAEYFTKPFDIQKFVRYIKSILQSKPSDSKN